MRLFKKKMYVMDKNYETLKKYESMMGELYPKDKITYFTHYSELEKFIKDDIPNIVILDGDSPYGIITAKRVKEINNKIKIIISSSKEDMALEAYQNGINGYLKKPFNVETIKETIKNVNKELEIKYVKNN